MRGNRHKEKVKWNRDELRKHNRERGHAMLGLEKYLSKSTIESSLLHSSNPGLADKWLAIAWTCTPKISATRASRNSALFARRLAGGSLLHRRERAALAWAEAVTLVRKSCPDEVYEAARKE